MQFVDALHLIKTISELHAHGLVHGELSVHNIHSTHYRLHDFGRLCLPTLKHCARSSGNDRSTVVYAAPEASHETGKLTDRADIWSFAAVMLHAWTGIEPYSGLSRAQILAQHAAGVAPPLECAEEPLFDGMRDVLQRCFAADPAQRPSARELTPMLNDALREAKVRFAPGG